MELSALNIYPDVYVLVELASEMTHNCFQYVGVCQSKICEEEGEVLVIFMKLYGKGARTIIMDETEIKYIKFEQIKKIL